MKSPTTRRTERRTTGASLTGALPRCATPERVVPARVRAPPRETEEPPREDVDERGRDDEGGMTGTSKRWMDV